MRRMRRHVFGKRRRCCLSRLRNASPQKLLGKENGCANAGLHSDGFAWKDERRNEEPKAAEAEDDALICPRCGFKNERRAESCKGCGLKFTVFGFNLAEKNRQLEKEEQEKRELEQNLSPKLRPGQNADLEKIIEKRTEYLAPGMTEEQKQEQLCGHGIDEVLAFVFASAQKYAVKFREIRGGKKLSFNWAAFFLCPYWFYYRKLYKQGVIFQTVTIILSMLASVPLGRLDGILGGYTPQQILELEPAVQQALLADMRGYMLAYILLGLAAFLTAVTAGFTANKLYYKYVGRSLDEIKAQETPDQSLSLFAKTSSVSTLAVLAAVTMTFILTNIISLLFGS